MKWFMALLLLILSEISAAEVPNEDKLDAAATQILMQDQPEVAEKKIPLPKSVAPNPNSGFGFWQRFGFALGALLVIGGGLYLSTRMLNKKGLDKKDKVRIDILTQQHLSPRRTLAVVQVAGEALLIGLTDNHISVLKTLALIDDEVPNALPNHFNLEETMESSAEEFVNFDLQSDLKNRVGKKLKTLRRI